MPGQKTSLVTVIVLLMAIPAAMASALTPRQVLVVANSDSPESVALARSYAAIRGIGEPNIALIKTVTKFRVSRAAYHRQITEPLKQLLIERKLTDQIRCIVLMWGMPVRVMGPSSPGLTSRQVTYKRAADKAHYQMAIAHKFLGSVAVDFPRPRTKSFKPLGALFDTKATAPRPPLPKFTGLRDDINILLDRKQRDIPSINDPHKRQIAWRQVMAIHLDLRGLKGLAELLASTQVPTAPGIDQVKALLAASQKKLHQLSQTENTETNIQARLKMIANISGAFGLYDHAYTQSGQASLATKPKTPVERIMAAGDASVDSELSMLWRPEYKLEGWQDNPLYWRARPTTKPSTWQVLMTARIDGPSASDAMRIIKDSVAVEKAGLEGNFYIDAGGLKPAYDVYLRRLHAMVKSNTTINVVLDDKPAVFPPGSCPQAALYVGWYSLRKYVPAFSWRPGAVGWHIASFEAEKLRDPQSQIWCVKMIQNGVAATLGAVAEPLLGSFPTPQEFFALLLTGKFTLAECYWRTVPSASWRVTLIGDPLYNPFATKPQLDPAKLPSKLSGLRQVSSGVGVAKPYRAELRD